MSVNFFSDARQPVYASSRGVGRLASTQVAWTASCFSCPTAAAIHTILSRASAQAMLLVSSASSHGRLGHPEPWPLPSFVPKSSRKRSVIPSTSMDSPVQVHGSLVAEAPPLFSSLLPQHLLTLACINSDTLERPSASSEPTFDTVLGQCFHVSCCLFPFCGGAARTPGVSGKRHCKPFWTPFWVLSSCFSDMR